MHHFKPVFHIFKKSPRVLIIQDQNKHGVGQELRLHDGFEELDLFRTVDVPNVQFGVDII